MIKSISSLIALATLAISAGQAFADVEGDWEGGYLCNGQAFDLSVSMEQRGRRRVRAEAMFTLTSTDVTGRFEMEGTLEGDSQRLVLRPEQWIGQPPERIPMPMLVGWLDANDNHYQGRLSNPQCQSFLLHRRGLDQSDVQRSALEILDYCVPMERQMSWLRLRLPIVSIGYNRNDNPNWYFVPGALRGEDCNDQYVRSAIRQDEYAVLVSDSAEMTVEGDICAAVPTFVFYDARDLRGVLGARIGRQPMDRRFAAAIAVTQAQCGALPDEMRFVARRLGTSRPPEYGEFFSASLFPKNDMEFVPDNPEQVRAHWQREDRAQPLSNPGDEVGAILGALIVFSYLTLGL